MAQKALIDLKYESSLFKHDDNNEHECWTFSLYCSQLYNALSDRSLLQKLVKLNLANIEGEDLIVHCFSIVDHFHLEIVQDRSSTLSCFFCGVYHSESSDCVCTGNCLHIIDILINLKFFDEASELIKKYNWIANLWPYYDFEQLKFCLDHRSDPNEWFDKGWSTVLQEFIHDKENYEASMLLVNHGANPFIEGFSEGHVKESAYEKAHLLVKENIQWIKFIELCDEQIGDLCAEYCLTIMDSLIKLKLFDKADELIIKYNWIPNISPNYDIEQLKFCLDHRSDPNEWYIKNWSSVLQEFIHNKKNYEASMLLVNHGANPFIVCYSGGHVKESAYKKAHLEVKENAQWTKFIELCDENRKNFF
jgi:hypothetical protein